MMSLHTLVALVLLTVPSTVGAPLHKHHTHTKRSANNATGRNVGTGFTIAISMVLLAAIFFYLGMRRERVQSWRLWRPAPYSRPLPETAPPVPHKHSLKNSISCPLAVSSSAPVHPVPQPVEADEPTVRYLELPCKEVYEMGLPSPKRPLRATWLSLDRRPWWISIGERNDRSSERESAARSSMMPPNSARESSRSVAGRSSRVASTPPPPPSYPDAVYVAPDDEKKKDEAKAEVKEAKAKEVKEVKAKEVKSVKKEEEEERKSSGSSFMDWTGLEYVRVYVGRKLSCRA